MRLLGTAFALSPDGFSGICERLSLKAAEIWTVLAVETTGCGFLTDRHPQILFERHKFHSFTDGVFDAQRPDLSSPTPGGYVGGIKEYERLNAAMALVADNLSPAAVEGAALSATSWGIGQIMGMNFAEAGFARVQDMVQAMLVSEDAQLEAFANFLQSRKLDSALRSHNWSQFARGYNGPDYAKNGYDRRLAGQSARYSSGPLPDLAVRAVQLYLGYLGYHPGKVDGLLGPRTIAAAHQFQADRRMPLTDTVEADLVERVKDALPAPDA